MYMLPLYDQPHFKYQIDIVLKVGGFTNLKLHKISNKMTYLEGHTHIQHRDPAFLLTMIYTSG